jgi:hypothetical protein
MGNASLSDSLDEGAMFARYKRAVEQAIARVPVKNGVVDIDSIWVEASIPFDLLRAVLASPDLALPENVERINTKSHIREGEPRGTRRKSKRHRRRKVRN